MQLIVVCGSMGREKSAGDVEQSGRPAPKSKEQDTHNLEDDKIEQKTGTKKLMNKSFISLFIFYPYYLVLNNVYWLKPCLICLKLWVQQWEEMTDPTW